MSRIARNASCPCGSGKKFKRCCVREDEIGLLDPGPVPQGVKDATDQMMQEEGYTAEVVEALRVVDRRKRIRGRVTMAAMFGMLRGVE